MPLIEVRPITRSVRLGLWRMTETPAELLWHYPSLQPLWAEVSSRYRSEARQMERLSAHALLAEMTGRSNLAIGHASSGRPLVDGYELSISHTRGYAALMLSDGERVAVDIEQRSDRVKRIAHKFIRSDETAESVDDMLAVWSAKETIYKLYSEDELQYHEMQTTAITADCLMVRNLKRSEQVPVRLEWAADYVLTYALRSDK